MLKLGARLVTCKFCANWLMHSSFKFFFTTFTMHLYQGNVNLFLVKSVTVRYHRMAWQQYLPIYYHNSDPTPYLITSKGGLQLPVRLSARILVARKSRENKNKKQYLPYTALTLHLATVWWC